MSEENEPPPATAARLQTFAIFATEHSKYAYFLLAVAAAAIVYTLDKVLAARGETPATFERRCIPPERRCSSVAYGQYAPSSRLVRRAPHRSRCHAGFHHGLLEEPRHPVDCFAFVAVVLWGTSFAMGCERVKRLLVGLYKPIAEPSENPLSLGEMAREAGSSAKTQYYLFVGGVVAYAAWVLVTYYQS